MSIIKLYDSVWGEYIDGIAEIFIFGDPKDLRLGFNASFFCWRILNDFLNNNWLDSHFGLVFDSKLVWEELWHAGPG